MGLGFKTLKLFYFVIFLFSFCFYNQNIFSTKRMLTSKKIKESSNNLKVFIIKDDTIKNDFEFYREKIHFYLNKNGLMSFKLYYDAFYNDQSRYSSIKPNKQNFNFFKFVCIISKKKLKQIILFLHKNKRVLLSLNRDSFSDKVFTSNIKPDNLQTIHDLGFWNYFFLNKHLAYLEKPHLTPFIASLVSLILPKNFMTVSSKIRVLGFDDLIDNGILIKFNNFK